MFRSARRKYRRLNGKQCRSIAFECLERRDMLSGVPPTVVNVEVASTSWSEAFISSLQSTGAGTHGYAIPKGSSAQAATLTWDNLDQIVLTFSEDVQIDSADLSLSGVNTTAYAFSNFHYDPQAHVATWTLNTVMNKDRLRLDLDANGLSPVRDLDENVLDGEWTNNTSTVSGNGTAGGDFQFNFNVLPTDVNNTGNITNYDYIYIRQLEGKSTTSSGYIAKRDIDGSGLIDSNDWQKALDRAFEALPSGSPAGTNNDAPTTSGFSLIQISDPAIDVAVGLTSGFDDVESGASGLTYSIVSNSGSSLLDSASINSSTKELVLNAANSVSGRATIIVRASDPSGLFVDTPITIDIARDNAAPVLSNFVIFNAGAHTWIFEGDVSDADDDVSNFIVQFYGVYATRSAVDENGHFEFAIIYDGEDWGWENAITYDPHGLESNVRFDDLGIT